jgi:hypothetical protein
VTGAFIKNLVKNIPTHRIGENDLRSILTAPISGEIFVEPGFFRNIASAQDNLPLVELRPDAQATTMELSLLICNGFRSQYSDGTEEVSASNAGFLTTDIWRGLYQHIPGFSLRCNRNAADTSGATQHLQRPDYCLWVDGALLLKGEHTRFAADLKTAKNELLSKMNVWDSIVLRDLPFLLCYALGGPLIQFCVIFPPDDKNSKLVLKDISDVYDLGHEESRLTVMRISLNLFRVFVFLKQNTTAGGLVPYLKMLRGECGCYIECMADHVQKKCYPCINEVYDCLKGDNALPCTIHAIRTRDFEGGMCLLEIRPVCVEVKPSSIVELRCAIRCVLTALAGLHKRGFVHRDVRWPNVLRDGKEWKLADFELADKVGTVVPKGMIATKYLPPELRNDDTAGYDPSGDVFCVGMMVSELNGAIPYSDGRMTWVKRVTCLDKSMRPSAENLLAEMSGWLFQ